MRSHLIDVENEPLIQDSDEINKPKKKKGGCSKVSNTKKGFIIMLIIETLALIAFELQLYAIEKNDNLKGTVIIAMMLSIGVAMLAIDSVKSNS